MGDIAARCRQGGLLPPYCGLARGHDGPHENAPDLAPATVGSTERRSAPATAADWRPGDIVLATTQGIVLERKTNDPITGLPRWYQLSPAGFEIDGYDPDDAVLLARWIGGKRLPVIDLEGISGKAPCYHPNGATWAGNCIDCGKPCAPDLRDESDGAA